MRRFLVFLALLLGGAAPTLSAQVARVEISLDSATGVIRPRLINLFADRDWREAVDDGPGVTLTWTVERWRDGLFKDTSIDTTRWTIVVQKRQLLDFYSYTAIQQGQVVIDRPYPTLDLLTVQELGPDKFHLTFPKLTERGRYYYTLRVQITALTEDDAKRIDAFQGQDASIISKIYGLFSKARTLTAQTVKFRIP